MVNRKSSQIVRYSVASLIISKEDFIEILSKRISEGEIIHSTIISTPDQLGKEKSKYRSWHDYNIEFLKSSFDDPENEYLYKYSHYGELTFGFLGGSETFLGELNDFKEKISAKLENLNNLIQKTELLKCNLLPRKEAQHLSQDKSSIFIVHGHETTIMHKVARFIDKLGFKPIILHEQANSGQTIIEKIETYSNVGFGIILYTPCDLGAKKGEENNLQGRARQNVVFEHGYLIGKIGRKNVAALVAGDVETPSDISGIVYIQMKENWEFALAKELKISGYAVDMNVLF